MSDDPVERLRALCLALPEVTERLSHGEPTWFVRGKRTFVTFADHHHDDRLAFWCAAPPGAQQQMVDAEPERLLPPSLRRRPGLAGRAARRARSTGTRSPRSSLDAYRTIAPAKLVAQLDPPPS